MSGFDSTDRNAMMAMSGAIVIALSDSWTDTVVFGLAFVLIFVVLTVLR